MKKLILFSICLFLAVPCQARIIYVDANTPDNNDGSSWAKAYQYLQDALADANSSSDVNEIRVAQGMYTPDTNSADPNGSGDRTATFQLVSGVALKGGCAGFGEPDPNVRDVVAYETILSGDLDGDDVGFTNNGENSYHVVTGSGAEPNAVLDGFSITCGNANGSDPNNKGGGMYNNSGSPTVTNCTFRGNLANYGGGMSNSSGSPTITNCTFSGNSADYDGGGVYNSGTSPTLSNCSFTGNSANDGGGMYNRISSLTVRNCIVWGNSDSGGTDESGQIHTADLGAIVDDMESYDPFNELIWYYWENPDWTGSYVGLGIAPFQPVHAGSQSMEYAYDNTDVLGYGFYSECEYNYGTPKNWNDAGVTMLTLFFYGRSDNDANDTEQMYVGLADVDTRTDVDYDGDMSNIRIGEWQEWNIVLTEFTDVAMSDVRTIYLGFGDPDAAAPGGYGVVYFDDIRLGSVVEIDCSCVQGWTGSLGGTGNIGDNPLFVDANGPDDTIGTEDDNLRLSHNSPCIDAGDNNSVPADTTDIDGDGNTTEPIPVDLNGFPRFIDDLCTIDTGNPPGAEAIVDMGAYEFLRSDIDSNGSVDFEDYCVIAERWPETSCGLCGGADLTCDGDVDWNDLRELVAYWLAGL